ncbi:hypothetical protein BH24ACT15_BH24ACT15_37010 [soil metagenome]
MGGQFPRQRAPAHCRQWRATTVAFGALVEDQKVRGAAMRHAIAESGSPRKLGLAIDANHFATDAELCAVRSMIRIEFD